jgi:hypothetical protein
MAKAKKKKKKGLTPLQLHAIKVIGKRAEKCRDKLPEGSGQQVDFTIRIRGAMSVGCRKETHKSERPSLTTLLAWVLALLGPRSQRAVVLALETKTLQQLTRKLNPKLVEKAAAAIESVTVQTDGKAHGDVTGSLAFDILPPQ